MPGCDLTASAKGSITRSKISGDRGQPCLVPLEILNGLDKIPLAKTFAEGRYRRIDITCKPEFAKGFEYEPPVYSIECLFSVEGEKERQSFIEFAVGHDI